MKRVFGDQYDDEGASIFTNFQGRIAKWRFETLYAMLKAMLRIRHFAENYMPTMDYNFMKDTVLGRDMAAAAGCKELWIWAATTFQYVIAPLEYARRWV